MVLLAQRLCVLPAMEGVRWAFPCGTWLPSRAEWLLAVRSIQPEEKERIGQFVFARDAKAALAGRLMIRKLVAEKLNIPWNNIRLQRTAKGKPVLAKDSLNPYPNFNFNISHQGDYAVLAAESELQVGIDIMKTSFPGLLLGRKAMTNLDSTLKSRDITLSTKVRLVKAMVFPVVMCGCESWTIKKAERRRINVFELWC